VTAEVFRQIDARWRVSRPGEFPLYLLGSFDRYVTIRSQQQRAFNLAYYFANGAHAQPIRKVGIVGAGAGGASLSVACSLLGIDSSIVDPNPLGRFSEGSHRWVHPYVIEWPIAKALSSHLDEHDRRLAGVGDDLWFRRATDLPAMNWRSSTASEVAKWLSVQFDDEIRLSSGPGRGVITPYPWAAARVDDGAVLRIDSPERVDGLDAVVLALGYGVEATNPGYWDRDDLSLVRDGDSVLVLGTGDGGVADGLRAAVRDFSYEAVLPFVHHCTADARSIQYLRDTELPEHRSNLGERYRTDMFREHVMVQSLVNWFHERRTGGLVRLAYSGADPYVPNCSPFHRFLLAHLLKANVLRVEPNVAVPNPLPSTPFGRYHDVEAGRDHFLVNRSGPSPNRLRDAGDEFARRVATLGDSVRRAYDSHDAGFFGEHFDVLRWPIYGEERFGGTARNASLDEALFRAVSPP
jgi:hypothetical protein